MEFILCEHRPSPAKLEVMGVYDWPLMKKDVGSSIWNCAQRETRYFMRGKAIVTPTGGEPREFGRGDLVTFPVGAYTWEVVKQVEMHVSAD